jgi:allophanate hydrolase subunit 2
MLKSLQIGLLGLGGILASIFLSPIALSQPANFPKEFYRLQTQFTGKNKCLDIVNDGNNNQLTMADCGNYSGQFWSIKPTGDRGSYRLQTQFTGKNKCLDIVNDGDNNQLTMADCGNYSGQFWKIF